MQRPSSVKIQLGRLPGGPSIADRQRASQNRVRVWCRGAGLGDGRITGGAPGSGAQPGNRNARKHGFYTREAIAERRRLRTLIRAMAASPESPV